MNKETITEAFSLFIIQKGIVPEAVTPPEALDLMVDFFRSVRFERVEDHSEADMLLFQYGVYDWGNGENFELNITRQLMCTHEDEDDDENMFQLGITLFFGAKGYKGISSFNKWSIESPSIVEYVKEIEETEGYLRVCDEVPLKVEICTDAV